MKTTNGTRRQRICGVANRGGETMNTAASMLGRACLALAMALGIASAAQAQEFPARPIKIVVGFGPGGLGDIVTRALAQKMTDAMGKPVLVENMPGAGGITAAMAVSRAQPDGYTLLLVSGQNAISPYLFKSLPYDPIADFSMISMVGTFHFLLVTDKDAPYRSVREVVAAAQGDPARFNVGTISVGSVQYLSARLFTSMAKLDVPIVPFKSTGDVVTALRSRDVQVGLETVPGAIAQVKSGGLRAIATTSAARLPFLPDVPTIAESGVAGYVSDSWNGLVAPAKTPRDIVMRLNREIARALEAPDLRQRLLDLGLEPRASSPEALKDTFERDGAKWRVVIEQAKIEKQ
jgi:tripartite-type tricarboxylate transporter receptor subunit TctC